MHFNEVTTIMNSNQISDSFFAWPLTAADILQLAHLIQTTLLHFNRCHSSDEESYLTHLRIILHCYHLVMIEVSEPCYCISFQHAFNFKQHPETIKFFSFSLAEMINTLSDKTRLIDCLWFYPYFVEAVKHILSERTAYLINDLDVIQRLLPKILPQQIGIKR